MGLVLTSSAGDRLVITGHKTLLEPGQDKMDAKRTQLNLAPQFNENPAAFNRLQVRPVPRWRAQAERTKEDKREEMKRAEKQNWALLAPGQLQEEAGDEYDFGVRDYDGMDEGDDIEGRDYTFYGLEKSEQDPASAGRRGKSLTGTSPQDADLESARRIRRQREDLEAERQLPSSTSLNPFRINSGREASGHGFNASSGGDLGLAQEGLGGKNSGFGPSGFLGQNPPPDRANQVHEQRMQSFRSLLGANNGLNSSLDRGPGLINQSPDWTKQPWNPSVGSSTLSSPGNAFSSPQTTRSFDQRFNQQPAFGQPRVSGFSSLPSLDLRSQESKPNLLTEPSTVEIPRRPF